VSGRDSNLAPRRYKPETLPLELTLPATLCCTCIWRIAIRYSNCEPIVNIDSSFMFLMAYGCEDKFYRNSVTNVINLSFYYRSIFRT
jgi:hypothetical protein